MREQSNTIEPIRVKAEDASRAGVTGATINLRIRRDSNGQYWNGTAFQSSPTSVVMNEVDASGSPGWYLYNFNTSGLAADNYSFEATTANASIKNLPRVGDLCVGGWVDNISDQVWDELQSGHVTPETMGWVMRVLRSHIKNRAKWNTDGTYQIYDTDGSTVIFNGNLTPAPSSNQERAPA